MGSGAEKRAGSGEVRCVAGTALASYPGPHYHGVPVRGPGNNGLRMRLIKTARYA